MVMDTNDLKDLTPEQRDEILRKKLEKAFGSSKNPKFDRTVFANEFSAELPPPKRTVFDWPKFLPYKRYFGTPAYRNMNLYSLYATLILVAFSGGCLYVSLNYSFNITQKVMNWGRDHPPTREERKARMMKMRDEALDMRKESMPQLRQADEMNPIVGVYGHTKIDVGVADSN